MIELIKYVVSSFADHPENVEYEVVTDNRNVTVNVILDSDNMGKVIGRQGKIAKALRTLVHAGQVKENKKYTIEIKERGEKE